MSKTIAVLASVAALTFASGAQATGSHGSYFYGGGGGHSGHGHGEDDDEDGGVCSRIRNDYLRHLCYKIKNHVGEHPASP